jgi:hypothetical protein
MTTTTQSLAEVDRLLKHIQVTALDSEQTPIAAAEVPTIANAVVKRLVWGNPCLDQVVQEELDELRFRA